MRVSILCACLTLMAHAMRLHHQLPASTKLLLPSSTAANSEYREQDSQGFYSYGYRDESSAKAEYTTRDGSAEGFYSYVDADGQLQTVRYAAGGRQGFTASATNLPIALPDTNQAPVPVKDTPEVEMAKQAHFAAYREAELRAAEGAEARRTATDQQTQREADRGQHSSPEEDSTSSLEQHQDHVTPLSQGHLQRQLFTATLHDIYGLEAGDVEGALQLASAAATANRESEAYRQPQVTVDSVRVPVSSYYTVLSPDTRYTVETPTVYTNVPHAGSLGLGSHRLPISSSTSFSSRRINGESSPSPSSSSSSSPSALLA